MGLINYKDIDFNKSINKELKTFEFNGSEISVVPYLNINDKYDFVMITLQKSFVNNIYNKVMLDMYFNLHLVYMYTNIIIDNNERADEESLYDTFMRSGLITAVRNAISEDELKLLEYYVEKVAEDTLKYDNSFTGLLKNALDRFPEMIEKFKGLAKEIDAEKIAKLISK